MDRPIRPAGVGNFTLALLTLSPLLLFGCFDCAYGQRQMERLGRGVAAINEGGGKVFLSWRLLAADPEGIAFNVYRQADGGEAVKLNDQPLTGGTNVVDEVKDTSKRVAYVVRGVLDGKEQEASELCTVDPNAPAKPYLSIPLQTLPGCRPGDAAVGDLNGDGDYEIVLKQEMHPRDNAHAGVTGQTKFEAYDLKGNFLWRIDLGRNIREGAHYIPFIVYDLDGDGRAELACKTADGTIDGKGQVIGDADADWRNEEGRVLEGPEFLTVFDGRTGAALHTVEYVPPRGKVSDWGDNTGNRVDRFLACVAYLDGKRPSLVMCRGYYTRAVLAAWNWQDGKLVSVWTFDSDDGTEGNRAYRSQGNHNLSVGDVDGDGKDEIIYGACAIDHDGKGLYSTGMGHGDAMHLTDIDPQRPGLEVFAIHENPRHPNGANLRDAATGGVLWGLQSNDVSRGIAADIDPRHAGLECWASGGGLRGVYTCKGERISDASPRSCNMAIWWDGDVQRELLDATSITKWNYESAAEIMLLDARDSDCIHINGTKANPCFYGDIFGDWREEVIWPTGDGKELRIFGTTISTDRRMITLMHDRIYRLSTVWQNVGYNQPTQTEMYLGVKPAK